MPPLPHRFIFPLPRKAGQAGTSWDLICTPTPLNSSPSTLVSHVIGLSDATGDIISFPKKAQLVRLKPGSALVLNEGNGSRLWLGCYQPRDGDETATEHVLQFPGKGILTVKKRNCLGAREMVQQLRASTAPPEDVGSIPSIHTDHSYL